MSSIVYFVFEQSLVTSLDIRVPEEINIPMNNISSFTAIKIGRYKNRLVVQTTYIGYPGCR